MGNVHNNERKRETWFPNTAKMRRMCVSVYVCVCVCERERERKKERERERERERPVLHFGLNLKKNYVC